MVIYMSYGGLAQLVRASASHAEGRRFESATLHQEKRRVSTRRFFVGGELPAITDPLGELLNEITVMRPARAPG